MLYSCSDIKKGIHTKCNVMHHIVSNVYTAIHIKLSLFPLLPQREEHFYNTKKHLFKLFNSAQWWQTQTYLLNIEYLKMGNFMKNYHLRYKINCFAQLRWHATSVTTMFDEWQRTFWKTLWIYCSSRSTMCLCCQTKVLWKNIITNDTIHRDVPIYWNVSETICH